MECANEEQNHPDYKKASDAEIESIKRGDQNFPGIGYPKD